MKKFILENKYIKIREEQDRHSKEVKRLAGLAKLSILRLENELELGADVDATLSDLQKLTGLMKKENDMYSMCDKAQKLYGELVA